MKLAELARDLGTALAAAVTPKGIAGTERLNAYWTTGEGAPLIRWQEPCAFCRCLTHLAEASKGELSGRRLKGHCANLEKRATGHWPNPQHSKTHRCPC